MVFNVFFFFVVAWGGRVGACIVLTYSSLKGEKKEGPRLLVGWMMMDENQDRNS